MHCDLWRTTDYVRMKCVNVRIIRYDTYNHTKRIRKFSLLLAFYLLTTIRF